MDLINHINDAACKLKAELLNKDKQIQDLNLQNEHLKITNLATLDQIREYIKELEQIRTHYVDNNNNS